MKKYNQFGFTFIELILYIAIILLVVGFMVRFAWDIIAGGTKNSSQEEVYSQARILSERLKYEIRNASDINSVSPTTLSLSEFSPALNPTVITYSGGMITITQGTSSPVALTSSTAMILSFSFTNNSSVDNATKDISFQFTIKDNGNSQENAFMVPEITVEGSAEVRSN